MFLRRTLAATAAISFFVLHDEASCSPPSVSGVYPHLAMFNDAGECGTGAVVPWAERLWVITYAPHETNGSTDRLYEIDDRLNQVIRPESVGGTPAGRLIHRESGQLFIGPYAIDQEGGVRVIPSDRMPGRLTGIARHLLQPADKVYYATMEEGFYEVDVRSLDVETLYTDGNDLGESTHVGSLLPGYHGKGLYSGQGRLIYANNGELSARAKRDPRTESGVLAQWNPETVGWSVVRRNQFTEVTGPGGIFGSSDPDGDPIWCVGWDHKSLLLNVLHQGRWSTYRLPKGSHSYDGAHGWNTEWPRIRDIGEHDLLMTMHGLLWRFPADFSPGNAGGIAPRSAYLKVVGDFCRWGDRVVFGCDDSASKEFLNRRRAKGQIKGPGRSNSNLWFVPPEQLDQLGLVVTRGSVWLDESVAAGAVSDPMLVSGFERRGLLLGHGSLSEIRFVLEFDRRGDGVWSPAEEVVVAPDKLRRLIFPANVEIAFVRLRALDHAANVVAQFELSNADHRENTASDIFVGISKVTDSPGAEAALWFPGDSSGSLGAAIPGVDGWYRLDEQLELHFVADPEKGEQIRKAVPFPADVLTADAASIVYTDDDGRRWRLPRGSGISDDHVWLRGSRIDREVVTERDLFNCFGTFYELPARNAGGFAKIRPIATHNRLVHDYCSHRGLLVMSGMAQDAIASDRIVQSDDGHLSLWVGTIDDLWRFGKPRGVGGPWLETPAVAGEPSDPYLLTGYDKKSYALSHDADAAVTFSLEVDVTGDAVWRTWESITVPPGQTHLATFPEGFQPYWLRATVDQDCQATAQLTYE